MSRDYSRFERPELIIQFVAACAEVGHVVVITSVDRDYKEQYALFQQGREPLHIVNESRKRAGLPPITQEKNKHKVTWTLNSEHVVNLEDQLKDNDRARAFDFALRYGLADVHWDVKADVDHDNIPDYEECALIGESLGLYSGKRFNYQDWPHLQLKPIV